MKYPVSTYELTNSTGTLVHHIQYLPYGETLVSLRMLWYSERFTFTGKERDEETGYTYHGARYFDAALLTSWMAVDPMSDKYPSLSPYNYCAWNPVKLVDPNGMEWDPSSADIIASYRNDLTNRLNETSGDNKKEIQAALDELNVLTNSNQMYHVEIGDVKTKDARGETNWDYSNNTLSITLRDDYEISDIAHEMKHAYQFETGDISYSQIKGGADLLYDFYDEREAYNRSTALGYKKVSDNWIRYHYKRTTFEGKTTYLFLSQDEVNKWHGNNTNDLGDNRMTKYNSNNFPYPDALSRQIYRKDGKTYGL